VVSTLEYWVIAREFGTAGVYSWRILQLRPGVPRGTPIGALMGGLFAEAGMRGLLLLRLLALAWIVATPLGRWPFSAGMALLVATTLILTWRRLFGDDGSDQMNMIVLITLLLCVGPQSTPFLLQAGLWFIALQACLSYTTAGLAKVVSPTWRSGEAVYGVFNTGAYGLARVAHSLERRRWLKLFLCWSVIGMEILFPLCLLLPAPWGWFFLAWGFTFHLLCAIIMGLNSFFWAFIATYPAIFFVSALVARSLGMTPFP